MAAAADTSSMTMAKRAGLLLGLLLLLNGCVFVQAVKTTLPVAIDPDHSISRKPGASVEIICTVGVPLQFCRFSIPGEDVLALNKDQPSEDGIEYFGKGLDKNECGVRIWNVKEKHDGNISCHLTPAKGRSESSASVRLIVAKAPMQPELRLNQYEYRDGDTMEATCTAENGKPRANLTLTLDGVELASNIRDNRYNPVMDETIAEIKDTRTLTPNDHGKLLKCEASHLALNTPLIASKTINVRFQPQGHDTIQKFGYSIGSKGTINVTVQANPRPTFTWRVGSIAGYRVEIVGGDTDASGRLQANTAYDLGHGLWSAILTIDSVQKSDIDKEYTLVATNTEGSSNYDIKLSSEAEPPAGVELDAGSIIGIVIGAAALILAVFMVVFARATGRWCFAGKSAKRTIGESDSAAPAESVNLLRFVKPKTAEANVRSDTESTGRYSRSETDSGKGRARPKISLSQLFKRNKDKVSGADTDTMRTVVTMDDEKVAPPSEVTSVAVTPSHEGGIVYAELDLARSQAPNNQHQQQQQQPPRRLNEDKTEYAEILYTKPDAPPPHQPPPPPDAK